MCRGGTEERLQLLLGHPAFHLTKVPRLRNQNANPGMFIEALTEALSMAPQPLLIHWFVQNKPWRLTKQAAETHFTTTEADVWASVKVRQLTGINRSRFLSLRPCFMQNPQTASS